MRLLLLIAFPLFAQPEPRLPPCPDGPLLDTIPIALDEFTAFRPLGFTSLPVHIFPAKHSAFTFGPPGEIAPERTVRFPARVWVTQITSTRFPSGASGYQMTFYVCREFRAYFYHLKDINPAVKAAFESGEKRCYDYVDLTGTIVKCDGRLFHEAQSGEVAGFSGDGSAGVDFGANDLRAAPEGLVNLDHYPYDYPYYVSPVDYYPPELKLQLESKLGAIDGERPRTAEPRAGSYRQDVPGTAAGNWFYPGVYARESPDISTSVALVREYVDPDTLLFSIGTKVAGVAMSLYSFTPREEGRVNRAFDAVAAGGGIHCYEGMRAGRTAGLLPTGAIAGVLLVEAGADERLRIERRDGASCEAAAPWAFTEGVSVFER